MLSCAKIIMGKKTALRESDSCFKSSTGSIICYSAEDLGSESRTQIFVFSKASTNGRWHKENDSLTAKANRNQSVILSWVCVSCIKGARS